MTLKPRKVRVKKTNGEVLRALLKANEMTVAEAAELMRRPVRTVERWIQTPGATNYRQMHDDSLEIFRMRLDTRAK